VILPDLPTCFYFDVDGTDPKFPMEYFIQALFEEMAKEQSLLSVDELWKQTVLLEALYNVKGVAKKASCHGICHGLIFSDNHTSMKAFAVCIKRRLENRPDVETFQVLKKDGKKVVPLDLCVYSHFQNFRFYGNAKLTELEEERRPLVVAPYNRYERMPNDPQSIFLLTMVDQTRQPNIDITIEPVEKKIRMSNHQEKDSSLHPDLESFLLDQLHMWGNYHAYVSSSSLARKGQNGELYVAFGNATQAESHKHRSNNIFAIVNVKLLQINWFCHGNSCKPKKQVLPMNVGMQMLK
jgi:hypothetical protein